MCVLASVKCRRLLATTPGNMAIFMAYRNMTEWHVVIKKDRYDHQEIILEQIELIFNKKLLNTQISISDTRRHGVPLVQKLLGDDTPGGRNWMILLISVTSFKTYSQTVCVPG